VADGPTDEILRNESLLQASNPDKPLRLRRCALCGRNAAPSQRRNKAEAGRPAPGSFSRQLPHSQGFVVNGLG
jgi:hypothetical protein